LSAARARAADKIYASLVPPGEKAHSDDVSFVPGFEAHQRRKGAVPDVLKADFDRVFVAPRGMAMYRCGPRAGEAWGLREGQYWTRSADGIDIGPEDGEAFPLRAFAYLFELPFRLTEADVIVDAGDARFEGRRYYRVLAAWGGVEPNEHDQYRVWIDAETGQIGLVDYTVREQAGFVQARTVFGDYRTIDGVLVPHILTVIDVGDSPADGFIHKVVVHDAGFGRFTAAALAPDAPIAGR
jgi:hypothetical protein